MVSIAKADEIEALERKLEYLRAKKELDLEFKIIKTKLEKLNQDYSDVAEPVAPTTSTSESSEKQKPAEIVEASPDPLGRVWDVDDLRGQCRNSGLQLSKNTIQINPDSSFSFSAHNPSDG